MYYDVSGCVSFVEVTTDISKNSSFPDVVYVNCLLQPFIWSNNEDPSMILFAEVASLRVADTASFAVDPNSYLDSDGDYRDIFDLASSLFLFTVRELDAKSFWRGAGKSSRISVSPPEGIRLNHDR